MWFFKKEKQQEKKFKKIINRLENVGKNSFIPNLSIEKILEIKKGEIRFFKNKISHEFFILILAISYFPSFFISTYFNEIFSLNLYLSFIALLVFAFIAFLTPFLGKFLKDMWIFRGFKSKTKTQLYKEILDTVDLNIIRKNLKSIVKIAFLNKIGFKLENYINRMLGDRSYSDTFFGSKELVEIYLGKLNMKERLDFYSDKKIQSKIEEKLGSDVLLDLNKSYVLFAYESWIKEKKNSKNNSTFEELKEYIEYGNEKEPKSSEKEKDLINKLNRNIKNVVF